MEEKSFEGMKYLISCPEGFCENKQYPLVVFLHGRGARDPSTEKLYKHPPLLQLQELQNQRGYILLAPHCASYNWSAWVMPLISLLQHFRELPWVDKTRIYLTGVSMGGYGAWELALLHPEWFAAAMPLCGGGIC